MRYIFTCIKYTRVWTFLFSEMKAGNAELRLTLDDRFLGSRPIEIYTPNEDVHNVTQFFLSTLNELFSQRSEEDLYEMDQLMASVFDNNDVPIPAFESIFSMYESVLQSE
mgnify:CR=1 FL=1